MKFLAVAMMVGVVAWFGLLAPAPARTGVVTPATLATALRTARGGETLTLAAGDYGVVTLPRRAFQPALRIDARAARFSGLVLGQLSGVAIEGGTILGPGGRSYGVAIRQVRNVRLEGLRISGAHRGIVVDRSQDVVLRGNVLANLISDGIDIAHSQRVSVDRNSCRDFTPTPGVYDAAGKRLRDGDHADCIQAWSRPQYAPTADLSITDNVIDGKMQGVFLGNHIRNGVDDGGFDRVVIRGNRVRVSFPNGIYAAAVRGAVVTGNSVATVPGARMPNRPERAVRAKLLIMGSDLRVCGNRVEGEPGNPGQEPCR